MSRRYHSGILVLETEFRARPAVRRWSISRRWETARILCVILVGRQGRIEFRAEFVVRFNYGATVPWVTRLGGGGISAIAQLQESNPELLQMAHNFAANLELSPSDAGPCSALQIVFHAITI